MIDFNPYNPVADPAIFWSRMQELAVSRLAELRPAAEAIKNKSGRGPMTDDEARRWAGNTRPPRGIHQEKFIKDVPLGYLIAWAEPDEFTKQLRRYLRAPGVMAEIGAAFVGPEGEDDPVV